MSSCPYSNDRARNEESCPYSGSTPRDSESNASAQPRRPELKEIPSPPGWPIIGNVLSIDQNFPIKTFGEFADEYGEIFQIRLPGGFKINIAASSALVPDLSDETRFKKNPAGALEQVRNAVNDGLFTARPHEVNWGIAHRILMPAMGPMAIRGMFDEMHDLASQLVMKWARHGPSYPIMATDDLTRATLDTLALCSMGFRFNSYYTPEVLPFLKSMSSFLHESGRRIGRLPLPEFYYKSENEAYFGHVRSMRATAQGVLDERKRDGPGGRKDLLQAMIDGVDKVTGQKMTDESILDNLLTFLVAGHETTSGLLSFAFHELLSRPEVYRKAKEEVDRVVGTGPILVEHMSQLTYLESILRETLRLSAPIAIYTVEAQSDTEISGWEGRYKIPKGQSVVLLLTHIHRDKRVYGEDADEFKPERMTEEEFNKLPPGAWKPFGNGSRGCMGRAFAWQESLLILAMVLQNFDMSHFDPSEPVGVKQTLTLKPSNFFMRAVPRDGMSATDIQARLNGKPEAVGSRKDSDTDSAISGMDDKSVSHNDAGSGHPMTILYGSNSGTCENMAHHLASDAASHGFRPKVLDAMDAGVDNLPRASDANHPVIFITPSYEGKPADNATEFITWLENLKDDSNALAGVQYAVFGCGHHDWVSTFHKVPKYVDARLEQLGATRLAEMGLSDAAKGKMFSDFETWEDKTLWPALAKAFGVSPVASDESLNGSAQSPAQLDVSITSLRPSTLRHDVKQATVVASRRLTADDCEDVKHHLDIALPEGMTYRCGDYLAVLPYNPKENVDRAMRRFGLSWDATITVSGGDGDSGGVAGAIPTGTAVSVREVLSAYVELGDPATKRSIKTLAGYAADKAEQESLNKLAEGFDDIDVRVSVLDLLESHLSVTITLGMFLAMLPSMRVRQYSISSSPLLNPKTASITLSVLNSPAQKNTIITTTAEFPKHNHLGVASTYLASLQPSDQIYVSVRPSHAAFHLPSDPYTTPMILVAAGSGLAPFMGFLQERAALMASSSSTTTEGGARSLAPAVLYYGCRAPQHDDIYTQQLAQYESQGVVVIRRAYSRAPDKGFKGESKYVQDAMSADRELVMNLWRNQGARMYICGSRRVGDGVKAGAFRAYKDVVGRERRERGVEAKDGEDEELEKEADAWWEGMRNTRYAVDVFD